jgi:hypothetical protein
MKFCTLDLQNRGEITVYFNFTKTNPYKYFQTSSQKKSFFDLEIPSPLPYTPTSSSEYILTFAVSPPQKPTPTTIFNLLDKETVF